MTSSTVLSGGPEPAADHGPGLWQRTFADGSEVITNIRLAGTARKPGAGMINFATALLGLLGLGLFTVSVNAQYRYVFNVKHAHAVAFIEAISLDAAMAIFSLLALGLARAGKSSKVERLLILLCALASAGMNYAGSDVLSPRSVAAYIAPPLLLAVVVDRVIAVVRRHVLGEDEVSPFRPLVRAAAYALRLVVAPISTVTGARRALLNATPVPERPIKLHPLPWPPAQAEAIKAEPVRAVESSPAPKAVTAAKPRGIGTAKTTHKRSGPSKTRQFLDLVEREHGPLAELGLSRCYSISHALAPKVGLHEGTGRRVLRNAITAAQEVTR